MKLNSTHASTITYRIGVFQATYQQTSLKDYTPSDIAWIFAAQLALMWAPGPLFGRLIDTYGPAPVLYPCAFMCVFSLCMTSLADRYYQIFLAQGIGFGIGSGGVFTAAMQRVGFYGAVRYTALLIGILLVLSCFAVRPRLPRKKWNRDAKWFDVALFKEKQFAFYTFGSFFVM